MIEQAILEMLKQGPILGWTRESAIGQETEAYVECKECGWRMEVPVYENPHEALLRGQEFHQRESCPTNRRRPYLGVDKRGMYHPQGVPPWIDQPGEGYDHARTAHAEAREVV